MGFFWFLSSLQQPELLKLKEEMSRISTKIKKGKKELGKKKEEQRRHAADIAVLQTEIQDLSLKMADLKEKGQNVGDQIKLDGNDLEEYFRMWGFIRCISILYFVLFLLEQDNCLVLGVSLSLMFLNSKEVNI